MHVSVLHNQSNRQDPPCLSQCLHCRTHSIKDTTKNNEELLRCNCIVHFFFPMLFQYCMMLWTFGPTSMYAWWPTTPSAITLILVGFSIFPTEASDVVSQVTPQPTLVNLTCNLQCHVAVIERTMDRYSFGFTVPRSGAYEFSTCGPQCPPDNNAMIFEVCCGDTVASQGCTWETRVVHGESSCPAPGEDKDKYDPLTPVNLTAGENCVFTLFRGGSSFAERVSMQVYCPPPQTPPFFECGASGASYTSNIASMIPQAAVRHFVLRGQTTPEEYAGGPYRIETCGSAFPTIVSVGNSTLQGTPCEDNSAGQIYFFSPERPTSSTSPAPNTTSTYAVSTSIPNVSSTWSTASSSTPNAISTPTVTESNLTTSSASTQFLSTGTSDTAVNAAVVSGSGNTHQSKRISKGVMMDPSEVDSAISAKIAMDALTQSDPNSSRSTGATWTSTQESSTGSCRITHSGKIRFSRVESV